MSQMRRIRTLVQAGFRRSSPQVEPGAPVTPATVGKISDVPRQRVAKFSVPGPDIAVANVDGTYYAFSDICTHLRCSLSEGELSGTTLTCICHGSRFDVRTGDVLRGPANRAVQVYTVKVDGDDLVVDIPPAT